MGHQAAKTRDPGEESRRELRAMKSKVAAWIEEVRHERSLVGPGAHRMAYSRLLDQNEAAEREHDEFDPPHEARPRASVGSARASRPGLAPHAASQPRPEPVEGRARPHAAAPMAPRVARKQTSRAPGGRSLFAFSALALGFAIAPVGYLMLEGQHGQPAATRAVEKPQTAAVQVAAPAPPGPSALSMVEAFAAAKPLAPQVAIEKQQSLALPAQRNASRSGSELAEPAQVASVTKPTPEPAVEPAEVASVAQPTPEPAVEPAQVASVTKPVPEPAVEPAEVASVTKPAPESVPEPLAQKTSRPAPDPRAEALIADGKELIELGDVAAARAFFERAAELGNASALVELARTYDPVALKELKVVGIKPEPDKAIALYDKARAAGEEQPGMGLLGLSARLGQ